MGIGPFSSPVSDDKQAEIKGNIDWLPSSGAWRRRLDVCACVELIEAVLKTFTLQYTKAYAIALVKHIKEEVQETPVEWQLLERPVKCVRSRLSAVL